jgi:hypothetical protein
MATSSIRDELRLAISNGSARTGEAAAMPLLAKLAEVLAAPTADSQGNGQRSGDGLSALTAEFAALRSAHERQTAAVTENTKATLERASVPAREALRTAGGILTEATGGLGGTGLAALAAGLMRLFARGSDPAPAALPVLASPAPVYVEAALPTAENPAFSEVARDHSGLSRRVSFQPAGQPAVTIQVNAIDSRSFLDHSDQIARAVRQALLNSHSLRDVVGEL